VEAEQGDEANAQTRYDSQAVATGRSRSAILEKFLNLIVTSDLSERQEPALRFKDQPQFQTDATFKDALAQTTNARSRMLMRSAETIPNRGDRSANL
jgi:hypothetical protein